MFGLVLACGGEDNDDEVSLTGNLGEECISGAVCQNGLVCVNDVCTMASGDGDTSSGDGDGDSSTSDGDGDGSTGDGDGDTGGSTLKGLYEGPCLNSDDCEGDLWCAYANDRYWCTSACTGPDDTSCPAYPNASAMPACRSVVNIDPGGGAQWSCTLECAEESECPAGAQCFGSGLGSDLWCGFLL